jgi:HK97 gp10 family phage protein
MPNAVSWTVSGLSELDAKLRTLPEQFQKKALRGATSAGAKVIRDDARKRVKKKSGDLQEGIRFTTSVNLANGQAISKVFVSVKKAWYGRLVEGGTAPHRIVVKNRRMLRFIPGKSIAPVFRRFVTQSASPHPFMAPAAQSQAQNVVTVVAGRLKQFFDTYRG